MRSLQGIRFAPMTLPRSYQKDLYAFHQIVSLTGCHFSRRTDSVVVRLCRFLAMSSCNHQCFRSVRDRASRVKVVRH